MITLIDTIFGMFDNNHIITQTTSFYVITIWVITFFSIMFMLVRAWDRAGSRYYNDRTASNRRRELILEIIIGIVFLIGSTIGISLAVYMEHLQSTLGMTF